LTKSEISVTLPKQDGQATFQLARGGARDGAGRKKLGITTKVSLTLEQEDWDFIDECVQHGGDGMNSRSAFFRYLYLSTYKPNSQQMMEFSRKPAKAEKAAKAKSTPADPEPKKEAPAVPITHIEGVDYKPVTYKEDYFFKDKVTMRDYKKIKCYFCGCDLIKSAKSKDAYTWENHKSYVSDNFRKMYYCAAGECVNQFAEYKTNLRMQEMLALDHKLIIEAITEDNRKVESWREANGYKSTPADPNDEYLKRKQKDYEEMSSYGDMD
jgi:hypothetical protein